MHIKKWRNVKEVKRSSYTSILLKGLCGGTRVTILERGEVRLKGEGSSSNGICLEDRERERERERERGGRGRERE